jgi:aspergillopepsin I
MLALQSLLTLAVLWGPALATPDPLVEAFRNKRTFSLQQVPVKRRSVWNGPMSMRRAYMKHGIDVPEHISRAAIEAEKMPPVGGKTSVPVRPVKGDVEYLITVGVGNHNLSLDLDTGSSDLYVHPIPLNRYTMNFQSTVFHLRMLFFSISF